MKLEPGERKKVSKETILPDENRPLLHRGDLYPAAILDNVDVKTEDGIVKIIPKVDEDSE